MLKAGLFVSALAAAVLAQAQPAPAQVPAQQPLPDAPASPRPGVAPRASAARGQAIAQRWCAECHVVSPDQKSAKADVPSFAAIASRRPAGGAVPLETFLMNPHPRMPDMQLTRNEVADLVAYIRSQKAK